MRNASGGNGFFSNAKSATTSGSRWRNHRWKTGWNCWMPSAATSPGAVTSRPMRNISAGGSGNGFPRPEFDGVPQSVHPAQNEADHVHNPHDHPDDDDNAQ